MSIEPLFSIPLHWQVTTLGEACKRGGGNIQTGPFGSQLHASDYVAFGIPSIMPQNIGDNRVINTDIARIPREDAERLSRYRVQPGDIVYSRRGDVERRGLIRNNENGWLCGTGCLRIRVGNGTLDPTFTSFYLAHPEVKNWIVRHAIGATMPNLNTSILSALPIIIPPVKEQQEIAELLGTLDDKIELNRLMNETLEAIARAIFKSWFVDFDPVQAKTEGQQTVGIRADLAALFPSMFTKVNNDFIPDGWSLGTLADLIEIYDAKRIPLSTRERAARKGPYPYYGATSIMDHVDQFLFDGVYVLVGEDGSVVNDDDTPIVQYVWGKFWVNNHAHVLKGKNGFSEEYLVNMLRFVNIRPYVTGAVQPKLNQANLFRVPMVLPGLQVLQHFNKVVSPLYQRFRHNVEESRTLGGLRDLLLPKLISGEIRIKQAEKLIEAHV
ncbi:MAG TPA: restriction endonuclease subunit S [Candidatus Angelobacter sp.]|nr:restriction endonuclease subunit S [Candidatus Angelobacter sp.]